MKPASPQVVTDSERLLREILKVVGDFPQKLKFVTAPMLTDLAIRGVLRAKEAARASRIPKAQQAKLHELIDLNDQIQALLGACYDVRCFKSQGQFNDIAKLAAGIGAQCGGWLREIKAQHPIRQIPESSATQERPGNLSTHGASFGATT